MAEVQPPRRWLFTLTILAGSFLLFLVQPMVAHMALPRLGGAPNVWNSAMLVYQALLLGGYAYAHALSRLPIARQAMVHLALLVLAGITLPLALPNIAPPRAGYEALWVPWLFILTVGPAFFVISAQAPLMQRWFAANPAAGDPYPLYAASNLGSFAGLLAYPLLAEPLLRIGTQSRGWAVGYGALILLVAAAGWSRKDAAPSEAAMEPTPAPARSRVLLWLVLAAVPSGLMLSTTTYLTTDIFAMPLLWVIPLGLYLLSFSIAFAARRGVADALTWAAPPVILAAGGIAMFTSDQPSLAAALASVVLLFVAAVVLHARLYALRPEPARLTQFYLVMSAGGALGGLFTALIAPLVFDWTWEHPILILAAAALLPLEAWRTLLDRLVSARLRSLVIALLLFAAFMATLWLNRNALPTDPRTLGELAVFLFVVVAGTLLTERRWAYVAACACLLAGLGGIAQAELTLDGARSRSYFGIYTQRDLDSGYRILMHGKTLHGVQPLFPWRATEPTTYYGPLSGVGQGLLEAPGIFGQHARVGAVGLGVGTLACYRQPGQRWTFFEIDPAVLAYSRRHQFTYLDRCAAGVPVVIGDARLNLAKVAPGSFDVLVLDAFTSDAIPVHLLTEEAEQVYARALAPKGLLLVHISNRYVDLQPVIAALARKQGLASAVRLNTLDIGWPETPSQWIALSRDPHTIAALTRGGGWRPLGRPAGLVWTDDYASILPHLTWRKFL
jgi:SAM-dependent methyltransferase